MRLVPLAVFLVTSTGLAGSALAQESEFQAKMQEDLEGYRVQLESGCRFKGSLAWTGGKLGHNPRESAKPEWNALSTLATTALDTLSSTCVDNKPVKRVASGLKSIQIKRGKGPIAFKRAGATLVFTIDPAYTDNNPAGQGTDLAAALKQAWDN